MRHIFYAALAAFFLVPSVYSVLAGDASAEPRQGVLLLKNGEMISGLISLAGDRYAVIEHDTETYVKRGEVLAVCRDTQECYLHRRKTIDVGRVQDHVELAEWCLRQGLLAAAERELADAKAADAAFPKIPLVERRLQIAHENQRKIEPTPLSDRKGTNDELDRLATNLPAGSMELFTSAIQPMLLNNCTKTGCHGPQSTGTLRLERLPISKTSGRRPTQRNLQATLTFIDRSHPEESKLLLMPIRQHGPAAGPIFTERDQVQYRQLVQWVYLVSGARPSVAMPTLEERTAPLLQTMQRGGKQPAAPPTSSLARGTRHNAAPVEQPAWQESFLETIRQSYPFSPDSSVPQAANESEAAPTIVTPAAGPATSNPPAVDAPSAGAAKSPAASGPARGNAPPVRPPGPLDNRRPEAPAPSRSEAFTPRDPFDPEIFNRGLKP